MLGVDIIGERREQSISLFVFSIIEAYKNKYNLEGKQKTELFFCKR